MLDGRKRTDGGGIFLPVDTGGKTSKRGESEGPASDGDACAAAVRREVADSVHTREEKMLSEHDYVWRLARRIDGSCRQRRRDA